MTSQTPAAGLLLALASAALYGTTIVATRLASFEGITGVALVFYRVLLMLALVVPLAALARLNLRVAPGERGTMLVLGASTVALGIAYLSSVTFIPVTIAVVIFYTFPALIVLASPLVERRRLDGALLGVAALALTGVVLVVGPAFEGLDPRGLALAGLASLATAVQFFAAARARGTSVAAKVFWIHLFVLPATALVGLATQSFVPPKVLLLAPVAVAFTIGGYVLGFVLQIAALARSSAVVAGIAYCAEPVVAALTSALVLDERLTGIQVLGGILVLGAIVTNVLVEQRRPVAGPISDSMSSTP